MVSTRPRVTWATAPRGWGILARAEELPRSGSLHEDELLGIEENVSEVAPGFGVVGLAVLLALLGEKIECGIELRFRWLAAKCAHVHRLNAFLVGAIGNGLNTFRPQSRLLKNEGIIQHHQGLGGNIGYRAASHRGERRGEIESGEHRVEEVSPHGQVDASPAVAVQRAARRFAPANIMLRQVRQDRRAFHRPVESAGYGQNRIPDRLGLEASSVLLVQKFVEWIDGADFGVRLIDLFP
jgi:hypothetical protein